MSAEKSPNESGKEFKEETGSMSFSRPSEQDDDNDDIPKSPENSVRDVHPIFTSSSEESEPEQPSTSQERAHNVSDEHNYAATGYIPEPGTSVTVHEEHNYANMKDLGEESDGSEKKRKKVLRVKIGDSPRRKTFPKSPQLNIGDSDRMVSTDTSECRSRSESEGSIGEGVEAGTSWRNENTKSKDSQVKESRSTAIPEESPFLLSSATAVSNRQPEDLSEFKCLSESQHQEEEDVVPLDSPHVPKPPPPVLKNAAPERGLVVLIETPQLERYDVCDSELNTPVEMPVLERYDEYDAERKTSSVMSMKRHPEDPALKKTVDFQGTHSSEFLGQEPGKPEKAKYPEKKDSNSLNPADLKCLPKSSNEEKGQEDIVFAALSPPVLEKVDLESEATPPQEMPELERYDKYDHLHILALTSMQRITTENVAVLEKFSSTDNDGGTESETTAISGPGEWQKDLKKSPIMN